MRNALERATANFYIALAIDMAASLAILFHSYNTVGTLRAVKYGYNELDESWIERVALWDQASIIAIVTTIAVGVTLVRWLQACYSHAREYIKATGFRYERWVWLAWIIPFVSLYKPYQVIREIYQAGSANYQEPNGWKSTPGSFAIAAWWVFYAIAHLVVWSLTKVVLKDFSASSIAFSEIIDSYVFTAFACTLSLVVATLWFPVASHLTNRLVGRHAIPHSSEGTPSSVRVEAKDGGTMIHPLESIVAATSPARAEGQLLVSDAHRPSQTGSNSKVANRSTEEKGGVHDVEDPDAPTLLSENDLYEIAWTELEVRKGDKGLWAKAYSVSEGDKERAKAYYLRERARALAARQEQRLADYMEAKDKDATEKDRRARKIYLDSLIERKLRGESISLVPLIRRLREKGFDFVFIDTPDYNRLTPLMKAAEKGDREGVLLMLAIGADKDILGPSHRPAAQIARENGHDEVARLIETYPNHDRDASGVDSSEVLVKLQAETRRDGHAKSHGRPGRDSHGRHYKHRDLSKDEIVRRLNRMSYEVHGTVTVDQRDSSDKTLLMRAAERGDDEAVLLLLALGANKGLFTSQEETAVTLARENRHEHTARLIEGYAS